MLYCCTVFEVYTVRTRTALGMKRNGLSSQRNDFLSFPLNYLNSPLNCAFVGIKCLAQTWLDWQVKYAKYAMAIKNRAKSIWIIALLIATIPAPPLEGTDRIIACVRWLGSTVMSSKQTNLPRKHPSRHLKHGQAFDQWDQWAFLRTHTHLLLLGSNQFSCSAEDIESTTQLQAWMQLPRSVSALFVQLQSLDEEGGRQ